MKIASKLTDPKGYYKALGLPVTATADDIKLAFRDLAKKHHPDRTTDPTRDQFHLMNEAYSVLRDPRKRLQYDRERLGVQEGGGQWQTSPLKHRAHATTQRRTHYSASSATPFSRRVEPAPASQRLWKLLSLFLAVTAILIGGYAWIQQQKLTRQETAFTQTYERNKELVASEADLRARYVAQSYLDLELDQAMNADHTKLTTDFAHLTQLSFDQAVFNLSDSQMLQLDRTILDLAGIIDRIDRGQDWRILIEGYAGQAVRPSGLSIEAWELALLRLSNVSDYLAAQGLPASNLVVRFHAGFQSGLAENDTSDTVEIKLLCCLATN